MYNRFAIVGSPELCPSVFLQYLKVSSGCFPFYDRLQPAFAELRTTMEICRLGTRQAGYSLIMLCYQHHVAGLSLRYNGSKPLFELIHCYNFHV